MATHPRILAWEIPWTEKPGGLQSMGLGQRVQGDTTELACTLRHYEKDKFQNEKGICKTQIIKIHSLASNKEFQGLPWRSSGYDSALPLQGAQVQSLVGELESLMLPGVAKKGGGGEVC